MVPKNQTQKKSPVLRQLQVLLMCQEEAVLFRSSFGNVAIHVNPCKLLFVTYFSQHIVDEPIYP